MLENEKSHIIHSINNSWTRYQQIRLDRVRQQRQRMEHMKEVLKKYGQIISQLESKNQHLMIQLQNQKIRNVTLQKKSFEIEQLSTRNSQLKIQLQKQHNLRINLQQNVKFLKQDISLLNAEIKTNYILANSYGSYQIQYETLQQLYEGMKLQLINLNKQNLQLKSIIYESNSLRSFKDNKKDPKLKKSDSHRKIRSNQFGIIKSVSELNLKNKNQHEKAENDQQKLRQQNKQIKKLQLLVDKFRRNEQQHQQLIELLKNQKSKICSCHKLGIRSKNYIQKPEQPAQSHPHIK